MQPEERAHPDGPLGKGPGGERCRGRLLDCPRNRAAIRRRHARAVTGARAILPELTAAGTFDLVEDGWVREAILSALTNVSLSASIVGRVGSPEDVEALQTLAAAGLERVGVFEET